MEAFQQTISGSVQKTKQLLSKFLKLYIVVNSVRSTVSYNGSYNDAVCDALTINLIYMQYCHHLRYRKSLATQKLGMELS